MSEDKFDQALFDLDLRIAPEDMRLLKSKFDPSRTGVMAIDPLFEIKPGSPSKNKDPMPQNDLNMKEKAEVKSLMEEVLVKVERSKSY